MATPPVIDAHSTDLLFEFPQQYSANLVLGDSQGPAPTVEILVQGTLPGLSAQVVFIPPAEMGLVGKLPGLSGQATLRLAQPVAVQGHLPQLTLSASAAYESNTSRPTVAEQRSRWQCSQRAPAGWTHVQQNARQAFRGWQARWTSSGVLPHWVVHPLPVSHLALHCSHHETFDHGAATYQVVRFAHARGVTVYQPLASAFQTGAARRFCCGLPYQEAMRLRSHGPRSGWQSAAALALRRLSTMDKATGFWRAWWSRYQEARPPPPGVFRDTPPKPQPPACYMPNALLLFAAQAPAHSYLLFVCENLTDPPSPDEEPVVVPVRRVYVVINNVTLHRVLDGAPVPVINLSLSLDAASWTWGFEAQLPATAEVLVAPARAAGPVELVASINGTAFRVLAESISRERVFGDASIRVSGRGRNAVLAAPYAPVMNFSNPEGRTARQLMDDVLTLNGISLGWSVDWGLTDWFVPAGAFAQQGTWIEALTAIAGAAGGYLLPHPAEQRIHVRHRYPVVPWAWNTVTPDFVLPVDAVARESLRWQEKPPYNRVFVSGQDLGVLGQVTRAGTAGDILAPMVVDRLITEAAAARQRGIAVLADTGQQIEVSLRLPVVPETGIVEPGAFVEYQDGSVTRLGIVRSTQIEAGLPEVWQTLEVQGYA